MAKPLAQMLNYLIFPIARCRQCCVPALACNHDRLVSSADQAGYT